MCSGSVVSRENAKVENDFHSSSYLAMILLSIIIKETSGISSSCPVLTRLMRCPLTLCIGR